MDSSVIPLDTDEKYVDLDDDPIYLKESETNSRSKIFKLQRKVMVEKIQFEHLNSSHGFAHLPAEIIEHLIHFLQNQKDLFSCNLVCLHWNYSFSREISLHKLLYELHKLTIELEKEDFSKINTLEHSLSFERKSTEFFKLVFTSLGIQGNLNSDRAENFWKYEKIRPLLSKGNTKKFEEHILLVLSKAIPLVQRSLTYRTTGAIKPLLANFLTACSLVLKRLSPRKYCLSDGYESRILTENEKRLEKLKQEEERGKKRQKDEFSDNEERALKKDFEIDLSLNSENFYLIQSKSSCDNIFDLTVYYLEDSLMSAHSEIQHENTTLFIQVCVQNLRLLGLIESSTKYLEKLENRLFILLDQGAAQRKGASLTLESLLPLYSSKKKEDFIQKILYRLQNSKGHLLDELSLSHSLKIEKESLEILLIILNPETNQDLERTMVVHLANGLLFMERAVGLGELKEKEILNYFYLRLKDALYFKKSWFLIALLEGIRICQLSDDLTLDLIQEILQSDDLGINSEEVRNECVKCLKFFHRNPKGRGFFRSVWVDKLNKGKSVKVYSAVLAMIVAIGLSVSLFFILLFPTIQSVNRSIKTNGTIENYIWKGPLANCGRNRGGGDEWCFSADIPINYTLLSSSSFSSLEYLGYARGVFCHSAGTLTEGPPFCYAKYPVGLNVVCWYDPSDKDKVYLEKSYDSVMWRVNVFHTWFWSSLLMAIPTFGTVLYLVYAWRSYRKEAGKAFCCFQRADIDEFELQTM